MSRSDISRYKMFWWCPFLVVLLSIVFHLYSLTNLILIFILCFVDFGSRRLSWGPGIENNMKGCQIRTSGSDKSSINPTLYGLILRYFFSSSSHIRANLIHGRILLRSGPWGNEDWLKYWVAVVFCFCFLCQFRFLDVLLNILLFASEVIYDLSEDIWSSEPVAWRESHHSFE